MFPSKDTVVIWRTHKGLNTNDPDLECVCSSFTGDLWHHLDMNTGTRTSPLCVCGCLSAEDLLCKHMKRSSRLFVCTISPTLSGRCLCRSLLAEQSHLVVELRRAAIDEPRLMEHHCSIRESGTERREVSILSCCNLNCEVGEMSHGNVNVLLLLQEWNTRNAGSMRNCALRKQYLW